VLQEELPWSAASSLGQKLGHSAWVELEWLSQQVVLFCSGIKCITDCNTCSGMLCVFLMLRPSSWYMLTCLRHNHSGEDMSAASEAMAAIHCATELQPC
jgi:hypothetical protein